MFSFIEITIFSHDIKSLEYLRLDIFNTLDNKNHKLNNLEIFGIFDLIINQIKKKEIKSAYNIFLNSYLISSNFDNVKNNIKLNE